MHLSVAIVREVLGWCSPGWFSPHCKSDKIKKFQLKVPFMSDHDSFKSSRLDSHSKLGAVAVGFQTAPLEAFVIYHKW